MRRWFQTGVSALGPQARCLILALLFAAEVSGCNKKGAAVKEDEAPVVPVSQPVSRVVTDFVDFTGQTNSMKPTNIIARVTGYVEKTPFKEGSEVKTGDLLYVIDPQPYEAQLEQAKKQKELDDAQLDLAKKTLARDVFLEKAQHGAVSEQQVDQDKAAVAEAQALVDAQVSTIKLYQLNVGFTRVKSPIDGQVGRYMATVGNLVNQDQTLLTTVQSLDPMYVNFYMDEATRLTIIKGLREGRITLPTNGAMTVKVGLQNEPDYPHTAVLTFMNNQINPTTGSILMQAVFANPILPQAETALAAAKPLLNNEAAAKPDPVKPDPVKPDPVKPDPAKPDPVKPDPAKAAPADKADTTEPSKAAADPAAAFIQMSTVRFNRQFAPGMYVRVRLPLGAPHSAMLVIDRVIQSDQGNKCVFVVDSDGTVQQRNVRTGALQEDGLRVVEGLNEGVKNGLKDDDWVVTGAIQQVRRGMKVTKEPRPMPTLSEPSPSPPAKSSQTKPGSSAAVRK